MGRTAPYVDIYEIVLYCIFTPGGYCLWRKGEMKFPVYHSNNRSSVCACVHRFEKECHLFVVIRKSNVVAILQQNQE